jgi:NAD-dependent SIR2 family protein deacetylase
MVLPKILNSPSTSAIQLKSHHIVVVPGSKPGDGDTVTVTRLKESLASAIQLDREIGDSRSANAASEQCNALMASLRDTQERLQKTMATVAAARSSTAASLKSFESQWEKFQDKFQSALTKSLQVFANSAMNPANKPEDDLSMEEKREVLNGKPSMKELARRLQAGQFKNIVVVTGAGISTAAGIPDFTSPGTGLYHNLQKYDLPTPQSVFDIEFFKTNPKPFYELAKEIFPSTAHRPTLTHYFLRLLAEKGILSRVYTQNIDCLELQAGIQPEKLVQAHGSFSSAACLECGSKCTAARFRAATRSARGGVLSCDNVHGNGNRCGGVMKPCITFYGEDLPRRFKKLHRRDMQQCDLLIVMGTSLKVQPVAGLPDQVPATTPRLLLNLDGGVGDFRFIADDVVKAGAQDPPPGGKEGEKGCEKGGNESEKGGEETLGCYRDVLYKGECDAGVRRLAELCGWEEELDHLVRKSSPPTTEGEVDELLALNAEAIAMSAPAIEEVNSKWWKQQQARAKGQFEGEVPVPEHVVTPKAGPLLVGSGAKEGECPVLGSCCPGMHKAPTTHCMHMHTSPSKKQVHWAAVIAVVA